MQKKIKIIGDIEVGGERGRKEIQKIGQAHAVESQSGIVYSKRKSSMTLIAGTHGYAIGYVIRRWKK